MNGYAVTKAVATITLHDCDMFHEEPSDMTSSKLCSTENPMDARHSKRTSPSTYVLYVSKPINSLNEVGWAIKLTQSKTIAFPPNCLIIFAQCMTKLLASISNSSTSGDITSAEAPPA